MPHKLVKDKRIERANIETYRAIVEYYQDTPARDNDKPVDMLFESLVKARKWLDSFPREYGVWDGFEVTKSGYREPDERNKHGSKRVEIEDTRTSTDRRFKRALQVSGRSVVGHM